jgi:hypothetical protein
LINRVNTINPMSATRLQHKRGSDSRRWLVLAPALVTSLLFVGCGPGTPAGKVKLTGNVTCDGKPLNGGYINFAAKQGTANGSAGISADGAFTVFLVPGDYDVAVNDNSGMRPPEAASGRPTYIPSGIHKRFTSADTSGISVTAAADSKPVTIAVEKQ